MRTSGELINAADNDPYFLQKFITSDKAWCVLYSLCSKSQSSM